MINIHPEATKSYDRKALLLLPLVDKLHEEKSYSFKPNFYVKAEIQEHEIMDSGYDLIINGQGDVVGFCFYLNSIRYGISAEKYSQVIEFIDKIYGNNIIEKYFSKITIENCVHCWIVNNFQKDNTTSFYEDLILESKEKIRIRRENIPIKYLCAESEFKIGKVIFKPIDKEYIQLIEKDVLSKPTKESARYMDEKIRPLQGHVVGTVETVADPIKSQEVALRETKDAISCLRIFSGSIFDPKISLKYNIWGNEYQEKYFILSFHNKNLESISSGFVDKSHPFETITNKKLSVCYNSGLDVLSEILENDKRSQFQEICLDSCLIYSRCSVSIELPDKILYTLVALESIYLRNKNEPIVHNLCDRLAFLLENTYEKRKRIILIVKKIYEIRSSFIHHGETKNDSDALKEFMFIAFQAIMSAIKSTQHFKTKDEFINYIEEKKYS